MVVFAVPPFLDLQRTSSDTSIKAGENVELVCNATAKPVATIEWTRLGGALLPIGQQKKLVTVFSSVLHFILAVDCYYFAAAG